MPLERPVSFSERCLLSVFHAVRDIENLFTSSIFEKWVKVSSESGFLDLAEISLDFAVMLVLGLPSNSPHRELVEGRMLKAEHGSNQSEAGQALLNLVPLLPTAFYCFRPRAMRGDDIRARAIVSSALNNWYGTSALILIRRLFRVKSEETICQFTQAYQNPDIEIRITPKSWIFYAIERSHRLYRPEGPSFRAVLFGHLFAEILRLAPIRQALEAATSRSIICRDPTEFAFLEAGQKKRLDPEDQLLLFAVIYGQLWYDEIAWANSIAWEDKSAGDKPFTGEEIEQRFLELWQITLE